ncbi:nucleotide disphospho-sugar-binding domain-containing protein [Kutzneria sp. NPDC052558]|uniref:nucleotide disphospho-sugar-binding domain-containing protein n=1 Tax=Kutzneria sp. NPDC052558 TaxID=3364121 RepID=UPI0037C9FBE6
MRVLVTSSPGLGHMLPMVSISWALRAAGHDVLLAMAGTRAGHIPLLAASGLPVVQTQPHEAVARVIDAAHEGMDIQAVRKLIRETTRDVERLLSVGAEVFAAQSDLLADTVVAVADEWRPDLVVHSPIDGAGPLAAAKLGVPAVEQAYGLVSGEDLFTQVASALADTYRRHGVDGPPARHALLNVAPPSMGTPTLGWPMRYVPFNGGGQLPDWLLRMPNRPRVIVTLGTVISDFVGVGPLRWLAEVAGDFDADFVVTLDDTSELGPLPPNVRPVSYLPLNALLANSSAVIHHGGSGSTMTSLALGVPQLVVPQASDQFNNAREVAKRGVGFEVDTAVAPVGAADLTRLLTDASLATAAAEVKAEMAAQPAPADLVPKLVELAG